MNVRDLATKLEIALPPLTDEDRRLARTCVGLLADGQPVHIARLAGALGRPESEVDHDLTRLPWVFRDDQSRVIGYGGAIVLQTPHRLLLDGRTLHANCAEDALHLSLVLRKEAIEDVRVESTCPATNERITLNVSPTTVSDLTPPGAVMSHPSPVDGGFSFSEDLVSRMCSFSYFFASEKAADKWIAEHQGAFLLSIHDGFTLARWWAAHLFGVGDAPWGPS